MVGGDTCVVTPQLHSLREAGVASLRGWTVLHLTVLDIIPPANACGITDAVHTNMGKQACTKNREVDGGGDTGRRAKEKAQHKKKSCCCLCKLADAASSLPD